MKAKAPHHDQADLMTILTPTQFRVTILVGAGLKNSEIAKVIGTTDGVVKNFLRDIFARTNFTNRVQLALRYTHELETGVYNRDRLDGEFGALQPYVERALHSESHIPPTI
jgi:DNA-binding CsgD family transcriptional regulator